MTKTRVAVLISGSGSNLQALIDAAKAPDYPAEIALILSNKADAYGLSRARDAGIETCVISHTDYTSRENFDAAMHQILLKANIEFVCLAGFMRVLSENFVAQWQGKMVNIHPSLLPKHKGLNTHRRALEAGDTQAGCTVHWVSAGVDEGKIIAQKIVPISSDDTEHSIAAKVLTQEHLLYPEVLKKLMQETT